MYTILVYLYLGSITRVALWCRVVFVLCAVNSENNIHAARCLFVLLHTQQGDSALPLGAAAARRPLSAATSVRAGAVAPLCALLFALCLNCRRALKILYPPRQCRAGRSELRPGAGRKMTSRGLWPLLRKYENGKREKEGGRKKRASLSNTRKARLLGEEREGARRSEGWNWKKRTISERDSRQMYLRLRCTGAHSCLVHRPGRRLAAWSRATQHVTRRLFSLSLADFNGQGWTQKPFRCSHMKPLLPAVELVAQAAVGFSSLGTETSDKCRLGNNLTTALLSRRSLVRLEF